MIGRASAIAALMTFTSPAAATVIFTYTGTFQTYLVPITGEYSITAYGARGGNTYSTIGNVTKVTNGGGAARVSGLVSLTAGDTLDVAVGGRGHDGVSFGTSHPGAGGGGATWVADNLYDTLVVAAGGGGAGSGYFKYSEGGFASDPGYGYDADLCCAYRNDGAGGPAGRGYTVTYHDEQTGGGSGGGGLFSGGGNGAPGGGQGGGQGAFPGYVNARLAPGGGPSGYGGYGGGGGGDAFGAGGGGGGFTGGRGGHASTVAPFFTYATYSSYPPYVDAPPYGTGGFGGYSNFLGDTLTSMCAPCGVGTGDGYVTLDYVIPTGPGGNAKPPVGSVPEPASWALMVAGFGLTGAMARQRLRGTVGA